MTTSLLSLLHLCDSLFPLGAFAHSDGLEAATASGRIATAAELASWIEATLAQPLRHLEGPAVARAWRTWHDGRLDTLRSIDAEVHALRSSSTGREASRAMGGRLVSTWVRVRHDAGADLKSLAPVTLPVAFGAVAADALIGQEEAVQGYIYTRLAAAVSAAMRLMALGQHAGHQLLATALTNVPAMAAAIVDDDRPLMSFVPLLDIEAMRQQYVHSRLFRS
jgi:urease accessory protein